MLEGEEILMLSLSLDNSIIDAPDEVVFTFMDKDGKVKNGGTKKIKDIFDLFTKC